MARDPETTWREGRLLEIAPEGIAMRCQSACWWVASIPRVELSDGRSGVPAVGMASSPDLAIDELWRAVTELGPGHTLVRLGHAGVHDALRWAGPAGKWVWAQEERRGAHVPKRAVRNGLTGETTRERVLTYIKGYMRRSGRAPTLREIGNALGLSSMATVNYHLHALKADGLLTWERGANRTIRLLKETT